MNTRNESRSLGLDDHGNIIGEEVVFVAGQQEGQFEDLRCSVLTA